MALRSCMSVAHGSDKEDLKYQCMYVNYMDITYGSMYWRQSEGKAARLRGTLPSARRMGAVAVLLDGRTDAGRRAGGRLNAGAGE